jgi:hypothetical protein
MGHLNHKLGLREGNSNGKILKKSNSQGLNAQEGGEGEVLMVRIDFGITLHFTF